MIFLSLSSAPVPASWLWIFLSASSLALCSAVHLPLEWWFRKQIGSVSLLTSTFSTSPSQRRGWLYQCAFQCPFPHAVGPLQAWNNRDHGTLLANRGTYCSVFMCHVLPPCILQDPFQMSLLLWSLFGPTFFFWGILTLHFAHCHCILLYNST